LLEQTGDGLKRESGRERKRLSNVKDEGKFSGRGQLKGSGISPVRENKPALSNRNTEESRQKR